MTDRVSARVVVQRPRGADAVPVEQRYGLELEALSPIGATLEELAATSTAEFVEAARDADAILAHHRGFSAELIEGLEKCRVIALASVGTDTVDVAAATRAGIVVTNTPDVFIEEVAEHTMMLILAGARRLLTLDRMTREGRWNEARPNLLYKIPRFFGQTVGLVSWGNVARGVAQRLQGFGVRILAWDPYVSELSMTREGVEPVSLNELLERSDVVSVHAPLNEQTRHLLTTEHFRIMKSSALLVNTGRGPLVDEAALAVALEQGEIAHAALDVFEAEPLPAHSPLLAMENVTLTPHCASASVRMPRERCRRAGAEIALVLQGYWPRSCVNPSVLPKVPLERWQPIPMDRGPNK